MSDNENKKKFQTPSMYTLPAKLVKDPEIKVLEGRDGKPNRNLLKLTQVDSASSDYFCDVFVESTFMIDNPAHPLLKLRKGDFLVVYGKPEYRGYQAGDGKVKVAGEIRYPRDFALSPGEWQEREPMPLEATPDTKGKSKVNKLPW